MTARLLPHKDLIALLCRRCYGETIFELAQAYDLKESQVSGLLYTNRKTVQHMLRFLTIPIHYMSRNPPRKFPPKLIRGIWRKCQRCRGEFWTESRFIRTCESCKHSSDWKSGGSDFTTSGVRSLEK